MCFWVLGADARGGDGLRRVKGVHRSKEITVLHQYIVSHLEMGAESEKRPKQMVY